MRNLSQRLALGAVAILVLVTACSYFGPEVDLADQDVRLTILHTSDIHSRILPFDYVPMYTERKLGLVEERSPFGGIARVATIIKEQRAKANRCL